MAGVANISPTPMRDAMYDGRNSSMQCKFALESAELYRISRIVVETDRFLEGGANYRLP